MLTKMQNLLDQTHEEVMARDTPLPYEVGKMKKTESVDLGPKGRKRGKYRYRNPLFYLNTLPIALTSLQFIILMQDWQEKKKGSSPRTNPKASRPSQNSGSETKRGRKSAMGRV